MKQDTTIIMNFALFGEIIIEDFSLLLEIRNINIIVKSWRDNCKLLLISNYFKCGPKRLLSTLRIR